MSLTSYEQTLLDGWEDVHKKSQLTLWILVSLKHGPKHMAAIKDYLEHATKNAISADDKSMYRALRRFYDAELVDFKNEKSESGPDLKVYFLTEIGVNVVNHFIQRNITDLFFDNQNQKIFLG